MYFRGRRLFHSTIDWGNRQDNTEKNDMNKNGKNCNNENDSKSDSVSNVNSCNDNSNDNNNSNSSNGDSDLNTKFNTIGLNCNDNSRNSGSNNNNSNNKDKVKMGYYLEKGYSNNGKGIWITSKNFKKINVWSLATKDRSLYKSTINDWFNISNAVKLHKINTNTSTNSFHSFFFYFVSQQIHEPIENYNNSKQLKQQSQSEKE